MNTNFTIKNFRVFDENGVSLELKPITILTGCNSSGKSSIARAMLLLNSFLSQIRKAIENEEPIELNKYKIDFTSYPNNQLGRYDRIVHEGSNSHSITMAYTTYSLMLSKEVDVELVFDSNKNDELNNAYLQSLTIKVGDEVFYSSSKNGNIICNLNVIKEECFDFSIIELLAHNYCGLESAYDLEYKVPKKEYEEQRDAIIAALKDCDVQRRKDVIKYVRTSRANNSIVSRCKVEPKIIYWSNENDSLFMIPIIKWLDSLSKDEIMANVEEKCLKKASKSMVDATKEVVADYIASDYTSFSEYFKKIERDYLDNINVNWNFFSRKDLPCVVSPEDLFLPNNYFYEYEIIGESKPINLGLISDFSNEKQNIDNYNASKPLREQKDTFNRLYVLLMLWNEHFATDEDKLYYTKMTFKQDPTIYRHKMYTLLTTFATDIMREVLSPDWSGNMEYVSSSRVDVKRLYTLELHNDFSSLLKRYFDKKREYLDYLERVHTTDKHNYEVGSFINSWIQEFRIGQSLSISIDDEGLGAQIRLHKNENDKGRLLADEGYGITQLISILLQIETAILSAKGVKVNRFWGLSHLDRYDDSKFHYEINTIVVEEPEIHLHPKYQSLLASLFVEAYLNYNIHFIIETHSEYLIRRLQLLVAGKDDFLHLSNDEVSVMYIYSLEESQETGVPQVKEIKICKDGYLDDTFGPGFFDEATSLSRQLL